MDAYQANLAACGGDYEAAFAQKAANGINTYEECFFFGLDPMDDNARFVLRIKLKNSIPEITWEPVRDDRTYTVVAKESLTDTEWVPTEECANPHFFKVRVKLP